MRKRVLIFTGILGWAGGIATMAGVSSCDEVTCDPDDPECDDAMGDRTHDDARSPDPIVPPQPSFPVADRSSGGACDLMAMARPSVYVSVARRVDGDSETVPVDSVWYDWEGQTHEAMCIKGTNGACTGWIAGWEKEGRIDVHTEYCDAVFDTTVQVGKTADGCHVATEYAMLEVNTRGCMAPDPGTDPGGSDRK